MQNIITGAEMQYQIGELKTYQLYYEKMIAPRMGKWLGKITPKDDIAESPIVPAIINHGRWMVKCPFCAGAEVLYLSHPIFLCLSCFNNEANNKFLRVKISRNWKAIEKILGKRPIQNRNWEGESIRELIKENEERGIK